MICDARDSQWSEPEISCLTPVVQRRWYTATWCPKCRSWMGVVRCAHGTVFYPMAKVNLEVDGCTISTVAAVSDTLPMELRS